MIGFLLCRQSQVPAGDSWLTETERRWFNDRRSAKRVADWRLGRWTAKAAIGAYLERRERAVPKDVEILAAEDGAPDVFAAGVRLPLSLSLSHSHGRAAAAVAEAGCALGCDLELVEPRSSAFVMSYFTRRERAALAAADGSGRELLANLIWSAKESALKALRHGLRADTRSIEVVVSRRPIRGWGSLAITSESAGTALAGTGLAGRWKRLDDFVLTIVSRPSFDEPVELG